MSTLRRGTIRAYDAGTHEATVQVAGSLSVWLETIPVSSGIPAAEVDVGDECAVLFFTDDNPDDAVIIAVYPGVPSAGGGGDSDEIQDADNDTGVRTEQSADEDKVRARVAGTERLVLQNSTPHLTVTGNGDIDTLNIGDHTSHDPTKEYLRVGKDGTGVDTKVGAVIDVGGLSSAGTNVVSGLLGRGVSRDSATVGAYGLDFVAGCNGQSLTDAIGVAVGTLSIGSGKTLTNAKGLWVRSHSNVLATLTNFYGLDISNLNVGTNRYGIRIGNIAGGTIARYLELGTAPDFVVKGTGELARAANQTPVFIAEGTTPTLRQVQWKDGASITSGDRVMVLV
jgi:hypothetical protein